MKGPDLLQPQFGVLIRFRERAVAVSADDREDVQPSSRPETRPIGAALHLAASREYGPTENLRDAGPGPRFAITH